MIPTIVAALIAGQAVAGPSFAEIDHAIESNRLEQARQMLADAMAADGSASKLDRLMADLAFARKNWSEAQTRYAAVLQASPQDGRSAERAAIASMMIGDTGKATEFVRQAIASGKGSWKTWNAKAVLCDMKSDWTGADEAFALAAKLKPDEPQILNNRGWSLILRGKWTMAINVLEQAVILDPESSRIQNNLELARAAVADGLPQRRPGENDSDFASRLNDAGVVAEQRGNRSRAIAAFSRALEVNGSWYARAANNLDELRRQ